MTAALDSMLEGGVNLQRMRKAKLYGDVFVTSDASTYHAMPVEEIDHTLLGEMDIESEEGRVVMKKRRKMGHLMDQDCKLQLLMMGWQLQVELPVLEQIWRLKTTWK
jgi:hypothetical protein